MEQVISSHQLLTFVLSVLLGAVFCFLYDFIRALHKIAVKGFFEVMVLDLVFCLAVSVISFCFFVIMANGHIRGFGIIGEGMGFFFFRISVSRMTYPLFCKIISINLGIYKRIISSLSLVFDYIYKIFNKVFLFVKKSCK